MNSSNIKIKNMKVYIEDDYQIAYSKARRELGPDLVIVEKRDIKIGGIFGLFTTKKVKVTYGVEAAPPKKVISKNNNDELLDLLRKMGYKGEERRGKKEDLGVYTPYRNLDKNQFEKNGAEQENIKKLKSNQINVTPKDDVDVAGHKVESNDDEDLKKKIKEEILVELRKEKKSFEKGIEVKKVAKEEDKPIWKDLKKNEIYGDVLKELKKYLLENEYTEENYIEGIKKYFGKNIKVIKNTMNKKFLMLVGPTGVGKTTSCAKIVANKWKEDKKVGFITADTYRLEAVSQLKAYANIMKVPVEVINDSDELSLAVEKFKDKDFVVMDTAGRSPKNKEQMEELKSYLKSKGSEIEVSLVLSATSKLSVLCDSIEKFKYIGFTNIIFTKIDETTSIGALLSISKKYNIPISYITTGQRVPDDIELAEENRLAEIFVEGLR